MAADKKHLRQRGNVWWLHYRIPVRYKLLPECVGFKAILTKSLATDSLREARRRRDVLLHRLEMQVDNHYQAWLPPNEESTVDPDQFTEDSLASAKKILAKGQEVTGENPDANKLKEIATKERDAVFGLLNAQRKAVSSLKELTKAVAKEKITEGLSPKSVAKINRSCSWFLDNLIQDDIDIEKIDYDQVHSFLLADMDNGVAGSTLNGHLFGLRQVWKRAKQSKLVSGDSPFDGHSIPKNSKPYDPYTYDEVYALHNNAQGELKALIHAGATTGARMDELLTAEVKTPSTYNSPCWLFKFKDKGKTEQSTRVVPMHNSLDLPEGFQFSINKKTATTQFKKIRDEVLGEKLNELTGAPRKLSFHSFRTTVITELVVKNHINEKVVGGVTGHLGGDTSKVGSIRTYINADDLEDKRNIVDLLPWDAESD